MWLWCKAYPLISIGWSRASMASVPRICLASSISGPPTAYLRIFDCLIEVKGNKYLHFIELETFQCIVFRSMPPIFWQTGRSYNFSSEKAFFLFLPCVDELDQWDTETELSTVWPQEWWIPIDDLKNKDFILCSIFETGNFNIFTLTAAIWSNNEFHSLYGNFPVAISYNVIPNDQTSDLTSYLSELVILSGCNRKLRLLWKNLRTHSQIRLTPSIMRFDHWIF